jgi:predicted porin
MVNYYLSKRTDLYGAVMTNNNSAGNGYATTVGGNLVTTSVIYGIGMKHTF